jgi:hypothetical protein
MQPENKKNNNPCANVACRPVCTKNLVHVAEVRELPKLRR